MHRRHAPVRWQLTGLGILLCLLAALFAVEAKLAWFGPEGSPAAQISASKLQPADAPKIPSQNHLPAFPVALFLQLAAVLVLVTMGRGTTGAHRPIPERVLLGLPGFNHSLFFRPPPGC